MRTAEYWYTFENQTGAAIDVEVMVYDYTTNGPINKMVPLTSSPAQQTFLLNTYLYEEQPSYHGKFDFNPTDADCSTPVKSGASMQITDPTLTTVKFCHNMPHSDPIYVVDKNAACPTGSSELKRW